MPQPDALYCAVLYLHIGLWCAAACRVQCVYIDRVLFVSVGNIAIFARYIDFEVEVL